MSRIGKKPIAIPAGVEVKIDGKEVTVKGAKGTLHHTVAGEIEAKVEGNEVIVTRPNDAKENRSLHGLTRTLIANMIEGVSNGYTKALEIQGVGYRAAKAGQGPCHEPRFLPSGCRSRGGRHHHRRSQPQQDRHQRHRQAEGRSVCRRGKEKNVPPSPIRARASAMPVNMSAARKANP